jgi:hypothetical protein
MICGTAHRFAGSARVRVNRFICYRVPAGIPLPLVADGMGDRNVLTTPWETIYLSSLRSDSECEERIWILQS